MSVVSKPTMEQLLQMVVEQGSTALHLTANLPPHLRIDDQLKATDHGVLSGDEVRDLAYSLLSPEKVERFERWKELDFAFSIEGLARFRACLSRHRAYSQPPSPCGYRGHRAPACRAAG